MVQQVNVLADRTDNLSLVSVTYTVQRPTLFLVSMHMLWDLLKSK